MATINVKDAAGSTVAVPTLALTETAAQSLDAKTPALGQALAAASTPVVLTAAQVAALTPPTSVSVSNLPATQAISAVALPLPSGAATEATLSSIDTKSTGFLLSTVNSSATPLTGSAAFTGTAEDVGSYAAVSVVVIADVASATDGLQMQQSTNGTNWDFIDAYTVPAATGKTFSAALTARYFRLVYTNGAGAQASFRLQTIFRKTALKGSSVRPQDARSNENDMEEILSYLMSFDGTNWNRLRGDATAGLWVQSLDANVTGQGTQTAAGQNIILAAAGTTAYDAAGMRSVSVQIVPTGTVSSGVVTFEASQDNVNFVALPLYDEASLTANPISTVSPATGVSRFFNGPLTWRYFRARISTVIGGGGSLQAFTRFSPSQFTPDQFAVTQATGANLNVAVASGTVTTVTTLTTLANGQTAHSSASTGSPVRVGGRVNTTLDTTLVQGDASDLMVTDAGQVITKPFGSAGNDWSYAAATGGILNTTTAVTVKAAGAASIRNYVTAIQIQAEALGAATEFAIRDGAAGTVLWRFKIGTGGCPLTQIEFPSPLRGSAATLLEIVTLTATTTGAVYANLQGYQSF